MACLRRVDVDKLLPFSIVAAGPQDTYRAFPYVSVSFSRQGDCPYVSVSFSRQGAFPYVSVSFSRQGAIPYVSVSFSSQGAFPYVSVGIVPPGGFSLRECRHCTARGPFPT